MALKAFVLTIASHCARMVTADTGLALPSAGAPYLPLASLDGPPPLMSPPLGLLRHRVDVQPHVVDRDRLAELLHHVVHERLP